MIRAGALAQRPAAGSRIEWPAVRRAESNDAINCMLLERGSVARIAGLECYRGECLLKPIVRKNIAAQRFLTGVL